jgi:hypothetical protein
MRDQAGRSIPGRICRAAALGVLLATPSALFAAGDLDGWFEDEIAPWLTEQARTHPRFKGEPIRVTVFKGDDEAAKPDLLSVRLAARLDERFSRAPGVRLAWRPTLPEAVPGRTSGAPDCRGSDERYLIVIDAMRFGPARAQVRVRALDLGDRTWVPGFTRVWQGRLSAEQSRQLGASGSRLELKGTRALPFDSDEQDLLAGRVAHRIACQLLAHPAQRPSLWPENGTVTDGAAALPGMIARELARYGVVTMADGREEADLLLSVDWTGPDAGPERVWVAVTPGRKETDLPSARVSLYARTTPARPTLAAEPGSEAVSLEILAEPCRAAERCAGARPDDGSSSGGLAMRIRAVSRGLDRVDALVVAPDGSLARLDPFACRTGARRRSGDDAPWLGVTGPDVAVFAIGAAGADAVRALVRETRRIPAECTGRRLRGAAMRGWLSDVGRRLARYDEAIVWRALYPDASAHDFTVAGSR